MTTIKLEGFDKYGKAGIVFPALAPMLAQGKWSLGPHGNFNIAPGLSASGYALSLGGVPAQQVFATLALNNNFARLIGGFRCQTDLLSICGCAFFDNNVAQLTIAIEPTSGYLTIREGYGGTVLELATMSVTANTIHYIEYDITFNTNGTMGGWTVWLDGVQALAGTGVTSQSGFNYANVFQFVTFPINFFDQPTTLIVDDMYIFDNTTLFNNAVLLSNPALVTDFPIADTQTQFDNNGNIFGNIQVLTSFTGGSSYVFSANTMYLIPFTPNVNCTLEEVVIWCNTTNPLSNFKGVVYNDSAGAPHTLLSSGTNIQGCTSGTLLKLPMATPPNLTANVQYWLGLIGDTNTNFYWYDGLTLEGFAVANTFGSGPPSTAPAMTGNQKTIALAGYCTNAATNWESEALNPPLGDSSSVGSGTVSTEDLYQYPALLTNAVVVYTVALSANCRLSFPGTHTFDMVAVSNTTPGVGSNSGINPTDNYTWYDSFFDTDPHTGVAWSTLAVTNAVYGMEITS